MSGSILLIEDNEQNRYLLTFLLEKSGYTVVSAADGLRGIEAARPFVPASSCSISSSRPWTAMRWRARSARTRRCAGCPIVAVTSYAMPGDREKALEAGCTGYIEKPINPATFVAEMESYLCRPRGVDE